MKRTLVSISFGLVLFMPMLTISANDPDLTTAWATCNLLVSRLRGLHSLQNELPMSKHVSPSAITMRIF